MMKTLRKHWLPALALLLALGCAFSVWRMRAVSAMLPSQQAAQRWKGSDEREFAQLSFFLPAEQKLTRDQIYAFRNDMQQKLKGASLDPAANPGLLCDAWCTIGSGKVSAGRQSGEVQIVAVGGRFFDFHPLRLLSGNYLSPNDVMDDRVLLDRETAWLLFGAVDLAGMRFSVNGGQYVVAGVYEHERDGFSKTASAGAMRIYMDYESYVRLFPEKTGIDCYELVMAEPVKGFARSSAEEKFPVKRAGLADNSYRFDPDRLLKLLRTRSERSMHRENLAFPYWENAARAAEDRAAGWMLAAALTGAVPAALLLYGGIRLASRGRRKLGGELLPKAGRGGREFLRARRRRMWERRHPGEF